MKLLIFPFVFICLSSFSQLFLIKENGFYGYMNERGEVVIAPKFIEATDFDSKYAWARTDGKYGCINTEGKFVLEPQYDMVFPFQNGVAKAMKHNESYLINTKYGKIVELKYNLLQHINKDLVLVGNYMNDESTKRNFGILHLRENRVIRTFSYSDVGEFSNGYAPVYNTKNNFDRDYSFIDSVGREVVEFGIYNNIHPFNQKIAVVSFSIKNKNYSGLIDTSGKVLYTIRSEDGFLNSLFSDGFGIIRKDSDTKFVDIDGKETGVKSSSRLNNFFNERTVVRNKKYQILTTSFEQIGEYDAVLNERFKNDFAIVKQNSLWGIIDVNGNYMVEPQYDFIDEIGIVNGCFFYQKNDNNNFGIADFNGKVTEPIFQSFSPLGFQNELIRVFIDDKLAYINRQGDVVWKEGISQLKKVNIMYMNRGHFYASLNSFRNEIRDFESSSKEIADKFPEGFSLIVDTNQVDILLGKYEAYKVYIVNRTSDVMLFSAQDKRLDMNVQAKDASGKWKDIEYLQSSWCGNSYHTLTLDPNEYWSFKTPIYEGEIKTKLRIKLEYIVGKEKAIIYSSEYDGSVNEGQFWNKMASKSYPIMDSF